MSAYPLLDRPTLFMPLDQQPSLRCDVALNYLQLAQKYWALPKHVRSHIFKILGKDLLMRAPNQAFREVICKKSVSLLYEYSTTNYFCSAFIIQMWKLIIPLI
jgi:hypothetical protein